MGKNCWAGAPSGAGQSHPELDRQSNATVLMPMSVMFFFNDSEAVLPRIEKK
jgi:hypothetical protein